MSATQTLTTTDNVQLNWTDSSSWGAYTPSVTYYSHWCYPHYVREDTMRKAFSIVKLLMDKKMCKVTTVKQFVDLVDEVYKLL